MPAFVTAAARALTIFEIFAHERRELSNADVAKLLQIAESSASDLLHTLVETGYLIRTERSRRFYPSPRFHALGLSISENDPIARMCNDALDLLSERTGETAISGILGSHHVEITGLRQSRHHLRYVFDVGSRFGLHVSALGKALLAELTDEDALKLLNKKPLKPLTAQTITDPELLLKEIALVRKNGYARSANEGVEDVGALAIAGRIGDRLTAFSISGPLNRFKRNEKEYQKVLMGLKSSIF